MTTVDWNPFNSNQVVTCSDDNSIRLWNVKHQVSELEENEINFLKAETLNDINLGSDQSNAIPENNRK